MHFRVHFPGARNFWAQTVPLGSTVHHAPGLLSLRHIATEQGTAKPASSLAPRGQPQKPTCGAPKCGNRTSMRAHVRACTLCTHAPRGRPH